MKQTLSLGYSTCPNDTFIFYALAHGRIEMGDLSFQVELGDVETLNQNARKGILDISKLSFAAMGHLQDQYGLLRSGSAMGRGCGPLIVAKPGTKLDWLDSGSIAVPGLWTTAFMLLGLFMNQKPSATPLVFDQVMPAVKQGQFDFGLIIHEGRFTFKEYGLECLLDLGEWWEKTYSMPIPLGGIGIRRDISKEVAGKVETAIHDSIRFAFQYPEELKEYVYSHAAEMDPEITQQHIDLYVNDFSLNMGNEGEQAVHTLFDKARSCRLLPTSNMPLFAYK